MSRYERFKNHLRENKKAYFVGAGCLFVGAVTGGVVVAKSKGVNAVQVQQAIAMYKPIQSIEVHIEALGDPGNIIQDLDTGIIYASQNQAAKELGVSASRISSHLNGHIADADGHQLVKLGKAMVSESA